MRIAMLIVGVLWAYLTGMYFTVGLIMLGVWLAYEAIVYAHENPSSTNTTPPVANHVTPPRLHPFTGLTMVGDFDVAGNHITSDGTNND